MSMNIEVDSKELAKQMEEAVYKTNDWARIVLMTTSVDDVDDVCMFECNGSSKSKLKVAVGLLKLVDILCEKQPCLMNIAFKIFKGEEVTDEDLKNFDDELDKD